MKQGIFDFLPQGTPSPAQAFCRAKLPPSLGQRRQALADQQAALRRQELLPPVLRVLWGVALGVFCFLALTAAGQALGAGGQVQPNDRLQLAASRAPLGLLLSGAVALALEILRRRRRAATRRGPAAQALRQAEQALAADEDAALGVPADAVWMDLLCRAWQPGDEARDSIVQLGDLVNLPAHAFAEKGALCLVWQGALYALPLPPGAAPEKVDHKLLLPNWNKPTPPQAAAWRRWHLSVSGAGVYARPYYRLALAGSDCVLAVPCYEEDALRALLAQAQGQ